VAFKKIGPPCSSYLHHCFGQSELPGIKLVCCEICKHGLCVCLRATQCKAKGCQAAWKLPVQPGKGSDTWKWSLADIGLGWQQEMLHKGGSSTEKANWAVQQQQWVPHYLQQSGQQGCLGSLTLPLCSGLETLQALLRLGWQTQSAHHGLPFGPPRLCAPGAQVHRHMHLYMPSSCQHKAARAGAGPCTMRPC